MKKVMSVALSFLMMCFSFSAASVQAVGADTDVDVSEVDSSEAAQKDLSKYDEETFMNYIWSGNEVYHEAVMFYQSSDGQTSLEKKLLYPIDQVVSVRSADLKTVYFQGVDYAVKDGKLVLPEFSHIPVYTAPLEVPQDTPDGYQDPLLADHGSLSQAKFYTTDDKNGLCLIYDGFHRQHTVYVTYTHTKTWAEFDGSEGYEPSAPTASGNELKSFYNKLESGEDLNVLVYGDSVATGASSTGANMNYELFDKNNAVMRRGNGTGMKAPTFFEQATQHLVTKYGQNNHISYYNIALGGTGAQWGAKNLQKRVETMNTYYGTTVTPDIIYVLFFANDVRQPVADYSANMGSIVEQFRELYPNASIVLLSDKVNNAKSVIYNDFAHQLELENALVELADAHDNCIAVKEFSAWLNITKSKDYEDYLSNNINHANDWWAMVTAQVAAATMARNAEIDVLLGDVDGDGERTLKDVLLLTKHTLGTVVDGDLKAMDVNQNGTVDLKDAAYLAQHIAGWENRELNSIEKPEPPDDPGSAKDVEMDVSVLDEQS